MNIYYQQFFSPEDNSFSVIIEDDGKVAYAYLLNQENLIGDVWVYNQVATPEKTDWRNQELMPFLNPLKFTDNQLFTSPLLSGDSIVLEWENKDDQIEVTIVLQGKIKILLKKGAFPGWSNNVKNDGPLAKLLPS